MSDAIIAALITGGVSLIGVIIANATSSKLTAYKIDELKRDTGEKIADLKQDFSRLRDKVEKHNNLVERMAVVEQSTKSAHHRIDDLKGGISHAE